MTFSLPDWSTIDTVFLDMDGTLLDLHYDNQVWSQAVPAAYAEHQSINLAHAKNTLLDHMRDIHGTIEFYSFDYWHAFTGLDLVAIHQQHDHLVQYRPGALQFLRWLTTQNKTSVIATNAHRDSVAIKDASVNICQEVGMVVSSQDFNAPKESAAYWHDMQQIRPFDPDRSLFIDDNEPVLDHARDFGIKHLWTVVTPDSQRAQRTELSYPAFDDFREVYPASPGYQ